MGWLSRPSVVVDYRDFGGTWMVEHVAADVQLRMAFIGFGALMFLTGIFVRPLVYLGVAYFLTFHVRTFRWRVGLLVACTIPFFTSNMIRMISWIPFLGRGGILNDAVIATHLVSKPFTVSQLAAELEAALAERAAPSIDS